MGLCLEKDKTTMLQSQPYLRSELLDSNAQQIQINDQPLRTVSLEDFDLVKVVGRGSFGKVMLVQYRANKKYYAMKILRKDNIEKRNQRIHTQNERQILESVSHPFIVELHFAFQTVEKLYLVTDFLIGGELFFHLRKSYKFSEERAKFYAAQLVLALEYLHSKGIIYRDLKPENIILASDGYIKITDFGLSKVDLKQGEKANTICGTPEYLAPEILLQQGHDQGVDWWSLGALLYEMLSGAPPFYSQDKSLMFRNRLEKPIEMKPWFSINAKSLLGGLLQNDVNHRIKVADIKSHAFFSDIDWQQLYDKQIEAMFKPKLKHDLDFQNIDPMFTQEVPTDTPVQCSKAMDNYDKFTYHHSNNPMGLSPAS